MRKIREQTQVAVLTSIFSVATVLWFVTPPATAKDSDDRPNDKIKGRYAFRMTPVKSFTTDAPGDPGGLASAPRQDILRVGVFTADSNGNLKGHTIATTDTNTGVTWMITFDWTGKLTMNSDGIGFFSVNAISNMICTDMAVNHTGATPHPVTTGGTPLAGNVACPADAEGHEDYAFVFTTRGGKRLEFIQTDNAGAGAKVFLTGAATAHEALDKDDKEDDD